MFELFFALQLRQNGGGDRSGPVVAPSSNTIQRIPANCAQVLRSAVFGGGPTTLRLLVISFVAWEI